MRQARVGRKANLICQLAKGIEFWQKRGLLTEITGNQRNRIFKALEILDLMTAKRS